MFGAKVGGSKYNTRENYSRAGRGYIDARPLVTGVDTEIDTAPVRRPLVGDPRCSVSVGERHAGAPQCRRGRDDRPDSEFANLVHWYFPQLEPGSEQDAGARHDHVDAFGGQLVRDGWCTDRYATRACRRLGGCVRALDVSIE